MDLSTIVLGLLTIVGSGVVSAVVTSRLNAQKTRQDLLRQKLEELFSSVQNFGHSFILAMISYPDARRRLSLEQAQKELQEELAQSQTDKQALRKCEMLVALYFPDLGPAYSIWDERQGEVVEILMTPGRLGLHEALKSFNQEQKNLEAALSKKALALLKR
jgi:hypothetical protein